VALVWEGGGVAQAQPKGLHGPASNWGNIEKEKLIYLIGEKIKLFGNQSSFRKSVTLFYF